MSDDLPEPLTFRRLEIRVGERPPDQELLCRVEPEGAPDSPCAPFALPFADGTCSEVFFRHGIQYFARPDAVRLLRECWRVLLPGGSVYLIAPNLDYYLDLYRAGDRRLAMAGLWGHPDAPGRVHRWAYNRQSLCELLTEAGFVRARDVTGQPASLEQDERHLEATARKHAPLTKGETPGRGVQGRQVGVTMEEIRSDHVERYHFAAQFVEPGATALDCACGVGYGAYLLATETACASITAVDIDADAIAFARASFAHPKITFVQGDLLDESLQLQPADCVVAFEVVEHIPRDLQFLSRLRALLKPGGVLLVSSPNEAVFPHTAGGFHHVRHYTSAQLRDVLQRAGLRVMTEVSQDAFAVRPGFGGRFNIAVCRRDDEPATEQFEVRRVESRKPDLVEDPRERTIGLLLSACHGCRSTTHYLRQRGDALGEQVEGLRAENAELQSELAKHSQALQRFRRHPAVRAARALRRLLRRR